MDLLSEPLHSSKDFEEVLLVGLGDKVKVGQPLVPKAKVKTEVLAIEKGAKIEVFRKKRRKQFKRHLGHRQVYTRLLVTEVHNGESSDGLSDKERKEILSRIAFPVRDVFDKSSEKSAKEKVKKKVSAKVSAKQKAASSTGEAKKKTEDKKVKAPRKKTEKKTDK